ncbi:MAG: M50 family metallopeptidase [Myxococcota bacterium]
MGWVVVIAVALIFGPFVRLAHELGYAGSARLLGARVKRFQIGFGRTVCQRRQFELRAIPLWTMAELEQEASVGQRLGGSAVGLAAIYLACALSVFGVAITGWPGSVPEPIVGIVTPQSAAEDAGLQPGDRILRIGGEPITRGEEVPRAVAGRAFETLVFEVERGGAIEDVAVVPAYVQGGGAQIGVVLRRREAMEPLPLGEAIRRAFAYPATFWEVEGGLFLRALTRSHDGIIGPLSVATTLDRPVMFRLMMWSVRFGGVLLLVHILPLPGFGLWRWGVFRRR